MAIRTAHKALWTPTGMVNTREKDVEGLTREEIILFSKLHEMGHKFKFSVVCQFCDTAFTGQNNDQSKVLAIACQCRELRFDRR